MLRTINKLKFILLAAVMLVLTAANEPSAQRIDISQGHIVSINIDYYFKIPTEWHNIVYAERITDGVAAESLYFFCVSKSGRSKSEPMFNVHIFNEKDWSEDIPYKVLKRNLSYIFAVEYFDGSGFNYAPDADQFKAAMSYANTVDKLKNLLLVSGVEGKKVYVRSVATFSPPEVVDGLYYLPLREVAESLGYTVSWWPKDSTVIIDRQEPKQFRDSFKILSATTESGGFKMKLINNRTYVHTAYFTSKLKANVEIGDDGNVYISE